MTAVWRRIVSLGAFAAAALCGCVGGNGTTAASGSPPPPPPVVNTMALIVDGGPSGGSGAINHGYVTVKVCAPGSSTQCASIDHVLLDTASWGLRLIGSVLKQHSLTLTAETDSSGRMVEECVKFGGGQTWGPIAHADLTLAGESAANLPLQIMDDTSAGAPPPPSCGANGTLINSVSLFNANGVLGVGVFAQDCGAACVSASTPLPIYYGCTSGSSSTCTAENVALDAQVTNPVYLFATDNNGVVVDLPNLQNANGDTQVQGSLIFGLGTQMDNALPPSGLTVLGTNASGDFSATYNGGTAVLPAWIDSGSDAYEFGDPNIAVCACSAGTTCQAPAFIGYYCPVNAPLALFAVNMGLGTSTASSTVQFALANPNSFVAGATAFIDLGGGGGSGTFIYGMPYFYGHRIYVGLEQRVAGAYTGPFFAY